MVKTGLASNRDEPSVKCARWWVLLTKLVNMRKIELVPCKSLSYLVSTKEWWHKNQFILKIIFVYFNVSDVIHYMAWCRSYHQGVGTRDVGSVQQRQFAAVAEWAGKLQAHARGNRECVKRLLQRDLEPVEQCQSFSQWTHPRDNWCQEQAADSPLKGEYKIVTVLYAHLSLSLLSVAGCRWPSFLLSLVKRGG